MAPLQAFPDVMSADIKDRIDAAIAMFTNNPDRPTFTDKEIVVMCLLHHTPIGTKISPARTHRDILRWITQTFRFFRDMAVEAFLDGRPWFQESRLLRYGFRAALPVLNMSLVEETVNGIKYYKISVKRGANVIAGVLQTAYSRTGVFPFFKLPAELRNRVYEELFQFPTQGLRISARPRDGLRGRAYINNFQENPSNKTIFAAMGKQTKAIKDILSPLLVNRQFREEADGIFFANNKFMILGTEQGLHLFFRRLPQKYHEHLTSLSVNIWAHAASRNVRSSINKLAKLPNLRKLEISISDDDREGLGGLPCVQWMKKICGLDEAVFPHCPKLEALLGEKWLSPKPAPKKPAEKGTSRKTKADDGEGGTKKGKKRKGDASDGESDVKKSKRR